MTAFLGVTVLMSIYYVVVESHINNLNVRRVDKTLIAKKRQDTLDMCRIFTQETAKTQRDTKPHIDRLHRSHHTRNRFKRDTMKYAVNPALNEEDEKRVEQIVDKLYDDLEEKDIVLKQKKKTTHKPAEPSRRFDFAPSRLLNLSGATDNVTENPFEPPDYYSRARWKHGIIPYFIDPKTYDSQLAEIITNAFDYVEKATCIRLQRLREKPTDQKSMQEVNWIYITNPSGIKQCVHSNENRALNGVQWIVFGYECMSLGDIVHEVMHILGYSHEHLRSDRDQYISILWENIKPGYKKYFDLHSVDNKTYNLESLPYDYASILHYPARAFSRNGQYTIMAEKNVKIGQREVLSTIDIEKVGAIYSTECAQRNREYLLKTCPSVVKANTRPPDVTPEDIKKYFEDRLWKLGNVLYKFQDVPTSFSTEEKENIFAVFRHIEKETCIKFLDWNDPTNTDNIDLHESEENMSSSLTDEEDTSTYKEKRKAYDGLLDISKVNSVNEIPKDTDTNNNPNAKHSVNTTLLKRESVTPHNKEILKGKKNILRRHKGSFITRQQASSILILTRSAEPGCKCPSPGKPVGEQVLEIHADCFNSVNDLLHFFVHVLGLDHQHNMHDRDSYLHIVWDRLTPEVKQEMTKKLPPAASLGFPYDYQSVMHYPWLEIKNGVTNIMYPIWNDGWSMGHWQGLSSTDVQKLNKLYYPLCNSREGHSNLDASQ